MKKILVVDDEPSIVTLLTFNLEKEGYQVVSAVDGKMGVDLALSEDFDFIILDVMLPQMDGIEITKKLRQEKIETPILVLTAKDDPIDRILGLEIGADDYLTKPFYREELLMRIKALLKRSVGLFNENTLEYNGLLCNLGTNEVSYQGQLLPIQGKEFELLLYFLQNRNIILTKEQIFDRIWGFDSETTLTVVEVYMSNLRKHLRQTGIDKEIRTLRNVGYIMQGA